MGHKLSKAFCSPIKRGPKNPEKGTQFLTKSGPKGDPGIQKRIWDLGLNSKNPYKGKIQALEAKLGLFWHHFWTFLGLCRYFHEKFVSSGSVLLCFVCCSRPKKFY